MGKGSSLIERAGTCLWGETLWLRQVDGCSRDSGQVLPIDSSPVKTGAGVLQGRLLGSLVPHIFEGNQNFPNDLFFYIKFFFNHDFLLFSLLQNKVFVYRGLEYERIEAFTSRIQTEFPSAQIYSKITSPTHAIKQSETQCKLIITFNSS